MVDRRHRRPADRALSGCPAGAGRGTEAAATRASARCAGGDSPRPGRDRGARAPRRLTLAAEPAPAPAQARRRSGHAPGGVSRRPLASLTTVRERIARIEITPRQFELVAYVALAALTLIVATGAAVRLSDSGLGCPDWPRCYGRAYPPLQTHALIEFSNRIVSGAVGIVVVLAAIAAWRRR